MEPFAKAVLLEHGPDVALVLVLLWHHIDFPGYNPFPGNNHYCLGSVLSAPEQCGGGGATWSRLHSVRPGASPLLVRSVKTECGRVRPGTLQLFGILPWGCHSQLASRPIPRPIPDMLVFWIYTGTIYHLCFLALYLLLILSVQKGDKCTLLRNKSKSETQEK